MNESEGVLAMIKPVNQQHTSQSHLLFSHTASVIIPNHWRVIWQCQIIYNKIFCLVANYIFYIHPKKCLDLYVCRSNFIKTLQSYCRVCDGQDIVLLDNGSDQVIWLDRRVECWYRAQQHVSHMYHTALYRCSNDHYFNIIINFAPQRRTYFYKQFKNTHRN